MVSKSHSYTVLLSNHSIVSPRNKELRLPSLFRDNTRHLTKILPTSQMIFIIVGASLSEQRIADLKSWHTNHK